MPSERAKRDWLLRHPEKRKQVARDWSRRERSTPEGRERSNARGRKNWANNKAAYMIRNKQWQLDHPLQLAFIKRFADIRKYGLTKDTFVELVVSQFGLCKICVKFGGMYLHVDHDHNTGSVRGLLCRDCNIGIGLLKTPEACVEAARYLQSH